MLKIVYQIILYVIRFPLNKIQKNNLSLKSRCSLLSFISESKIEDHVFVGPFTTLKNVTIKRYSSIAFNVNIGGMEHPYYFASTSPRIFPKILDKNLKTVIEEDVWVGAGVVIRSGVKIGRGSVVGSSSVVLEDVPPYSIVIGTPAKIYKNRFNRDTIAKIEKSKYWEYEPKKALNEIIKIPEFEKYLRNE